jgi:hypothetical protein
MSRRYEPPSADVAAIQNSALASSPTVEISEDCVTQEKRFYGWACLDAAAQGGSPCADDGISCAATKRPGREASTTAFTGTDRVEWLLFLDERIAPAVVV